MLNIKLTVIGAGLLALGACATFEGGAGYGAPGDDYAAGSALSREMTSRDRAALAGAFAAAVETGAPGATNVWSSGSYSGSVTPGQYLIGNLKPDSGRLLPVAAPIEFAGEYETELGLYALKGEANLRSGPSTEAKIFTKLAAGTPVDVVGRAVGLPWMLVAIDGTVRGYVHQSLLLKAPGDDFALAGGPTRAARFCRAFEQSLTLFGRTDRWAGAACKRDGAWLLEAAPAEELLN